MPRASRMPRPSPALFFHKGARKIQSKAFRAVGGGFESAKREGIGPQKGILQSLPRPFSASATSLPFFHSNPSPISLSPLPPFRLFKPPTCDVSHAIRTEETETEKKRKKPEAFPFFYWCPKKENEKEESESLKDKRGKCFGV